MSSNPGTPCFTILTVTFNAGPFIERTLKSVASQTYSNFEYYIIDGASRDHTLALCQTYASVITQIISEPDKGLYDAMNKGIRLAKGDYLIFLNAGDQLKDANTLQQVADAIMSSGDMWPDVVYGETEIVDDKDEFVRMRRLSAPEVLDWKSFRDGMLVCHQAFWASRELAAEELYDLTYRFSADFDWCIRIMKRSAQLMNTHLTTIRYLQGGMSIKNHRASLLERLRIMAKHYGWMATIGKHIWFVVRAIIKK